MAQAIPPAEAPRSTVLGHGSFGVVSVGWVFPAPARQRRHTTPDAVAPDVTLSEGVPSTAVAVRTPSDADSDTSHLSIAVADWHVTTDITQLPQPSRVPDHVPRRGFVCLSQMPLPNIYAVAVKRVTVPRASNALSEYVASAYAMCQSQSLALSQSAPVIATSGAHHAQQRVLWNELCLLDHIRTHPHPNIIQCWGFSFRAAAHGDRTRTPRTAPTTTASASAPDITAESVTESTKTSSVVRYHVARSSAQPLDGLACAAQRLVRRVVQHVRTNMRLDLTTLFATQTTASAATAPTPPPVCTLQGVTVSRTSLARSRGSARSGGVSHDVSHVPASFILDNATEAEVVLSLCSGGTLKEFVQRQATARLEASFASFARQSAHATAQAEGDVRASREGDAAREPAVKSGLSDVCPSTSTATAEAVHGATPSTRHSRGTTSDAAPQPADSHGATTTIATTTTGAAGHDEAVALSAVSFVATRARWTLAVSERCLVALLVALLHALHHVHTELHVLHRDVKPANVLLCVGEGCERPATQSDGASPGMWWSASRPKPAPTRTNTTSTSSSQTFPVLVAPADRAPLRLHTEEYRTHKAKQPAQGHKTAKAGAVTRHKVELHVLPQPEAWRVQLADFGVSTCPGQVRTAQRGVGTVAFMAPEVRLCGVPRCLLAPSAATAPSPSLPSSSSVSKPGKGAVSPSPSPQQGSATTSVIRGQRTGTSTRHHVMQDMLTPLFVDYGPAADVYALGATFQYLLVRSLVGAPTLSPGQIRELLAALEGGGVADHARDDTQAAKQLLAQWSATSEGKTWAYYLQKQQSRALAARWVDEEAPTPPAAAAIAAPAHDAGTQPDFAVPREWRCDQEVVSETFIRPTRASDDEPDEVEEDGEEEAGGPSRSAFTVPSAWRCREELLHQQHVRRPSTRHRSDTLAEHARASVGDENILFEGSTPGSTQYKPQQRRCRSCGKLHRHLIELLNAMTDPDPRRRPGVLDCLRSTAVLEQGQMEEVPAELDVHRQKNRQRRAAARAAAAAATPASQRTACPTSPTCAKTADEARVPSRRPSPLEMVPEPTPDDHDEGEPGTPLERTYLWRPPSLHFLKNKEDVEY